MIDSSRESERRVVTMLFCDVANSVELAAQVDAEIWAEIMDEAFDYMTGPVHRYEGTVARLMGDGMLAFFGAPTAHEEDPQRAVLAALEIQTDIHEFAAELQRDLGMDFQVRVGIHTGPVVVGEIGSEIRKEYTVMGDAANLAARMEQTADPGTVQISEGTYKLVAPLFDVDSRDSLSVKGRKDPVLAYRVIGSKAEPGSLRGIAGLQAPLIGRDGEFTTLCDALDDVRSGRGGIVLLIGEAGLGKSRLLKELRKEWVRGSATKTIGRRSKGIHASWTESRGVSYDQTRPYGLFLQRVRIYLGVEEDDPPKLVAEKIAKVTSELPERQREVLTEAALVLLAIKMEGGSTSGAAESRKQELQSALAQGWREAASSEPIVVVFDDLQWADPASVDLLINSLALVDEVPILFLCAMRPHRDSPAWQIKQAGEKDYHHRYHEIHLPPLTADQGRSLVNGLLAKVELPTSLHDHIQEKAEGNPFFLEEIIRALIDQGHLTQDGAGTHWQVASQTYELSIPETVHALLASRIDSLQPGARNVLQIASVIGRTFRRQVLNRVLENGAGLDKNLNALQKADLIIESSKNKRGEFAFRHELLRDAAYGSILRRRLRSHHRRVAEALESMYPDRAQDMADRLAHHYDRASVPDRALKYYVRAGDTAFGLFANQEAIAKYGRAIELASSMQVQTETLLHLYLSHGRALELMGKFDEAIVNYSELERLGTERAEPALSLAGIGAQATIFSTPTARFDPEQGLERGSRALSLARELKNTAAEAKALWSLMLVEYFVGKEPEKAIEYGEASLVLAREHGLQDQLAYTLHDLARSYEKARRIEDSIVANQEARELWIAKGNYPMLADNLTSASFIEFIAGNLNRAEELAEEAHRISISIGNLWGQAFSRMRMGPIAIERGDFDRGLAYLNEVLALADEAGFTAAQLIGRGILALNYLLLGQPSLGFELMEIELEAAWGLRGYMESLSRVIALRSQLYLQGEELEKALEAYNEARAEVQVADLDYLYGPLFIGIEYEHDLANGRFNKVLSRSEQRIETLRSTRMRLFLPDTLRYRSQAFVGLGRHEEASQALAEARVVAETIGSRRSLWPILMAWSELHRAQGDQTAADELRGAAQEALEFMVEHLSDPDLRSSFLEQPLVRQTFGD